jgi:hypothetical protein
MDIAEILARRLEDSGRIRLRPERSGCTKVRRAGTRHLEPCHARGANGILHQEKMFDRTTILAYDVHIAY